MGLKNSTISLFECNPPSSPSKYHKPAPPPISSGCFNKLTPPSYNHNWTDLHYAASHGNVRRIQEIIHKSGTVNIDKKDYYGKTPLYWAAYKGHKNCVHELLRFGAKVNTQCRHGGSPLHTVVSLHPDCVILLLRHGANVNLADIWGVTPMYVAAINGQLDVMSNLILAGAQLTYKNKKTGQIPQQLLSHKEYCDSLQVLERNPPNLQQLCRIKIRHCLAEHPCKKIEKLPLPYKMKDFVALCDLR